MNDAEHDGFTSLLDGGGAMGRLVASMDWSRTPLGAISTWPDSLLTPVNLALASNFPISLIFGEGRVQIYNDGYWPICGDKHPTSMGQDFKECWAPAWPVIGEAFESAAAGQAAFLVNQRIFIDRHGYLEETFFTFSFSPIRDRNGLIVGLFHPVTELTLQSLAERRLALVQSIADQSGNTQDIEDAMQVVVNVLRENSFDLPFAALYKLNPDGSSARLVASCNDEAGQLPEHFEVADDATAGWPLGLATRRGEAQIVSDGWLARSGLGVGCYPEACDKALVMPVGFLASGHPLGVLVAGVSPRRRLDTTYRQFYDMLADTVGNSLTNAQAYQAEKDRYAALEELNKAKTTFFSNISHEFRTPLTLMLGPLDDLLTRQNLSADVRDSLTLMQTNSLRLLKLVNALLDFSRIEAGRMQLRYQLTDLSALSSGLASNFGSICEQGGLELMVDCGTGIEAYVDRDMWSKIILNLLSNAFKFTLAGHIEVRLVQENDQLVLQVADTGVGVPEDELPMLFKRFHRVAGASGRNFEGSGIGLSLVKELAVLHGGDVRVESRYGQGTTFTVTLPCGHDHLPDEQLDLAPLESGVRADAYVTEALGWLGIADLGAGDEPAGVDDKTLGGRILVVDDNADMRRYITRSLSANFDVITADNGQMAMDIAFANPPDLVVSDVMMPRVDGFELLRALRADERTKAIPFILLSARAGGEARVEGIEAGADDYLVKPFDVRELNARVNTQLHMAALRRETESTLRENDQRKDSFLATLGHELRNPLAAIVSALELIRVTDDPSRLKGFVDMLQRQVAMLDRLIGDLLDVPRITHGKMQLRRERIEIGEVLQASLEEIEAKARQSQVEIHAQALNWPGIVDADRLRLVQVFTNLLGNAVKFTPAGGRVDIRRIDRDGRIGVSVRDNGRGIDPADLGRVFEMFEQLDAGENHDGLGIGLAIIKGLVELHGGTVEAHSEGRGQGAEFRVWLPGTEVEPESAVSETDAQSPSAAPRNAILLADDNIDACSCLKEMLGFLGQDVRAVYDGQAAWNLAQEMRPQIVILDLLMPQLDGFEVARRIRATDWGQQVMLVALSGLGQDQDRRASADAGFDLHLQKPVGIEQLRVLLESQPESGRQRRPSPDRA